MSKQTHQPNIAKENPPFPASESEKGGVDPKEKLPRAGERQERPNKIVEDDPVDEASWESFPASDPPAFNSGKSD